MYRRHFLKLVGIGAVILPFASCSNGGSSSSGTTPTTGQNCGTADPVTAETQGAHSSSPHLLSLTQQQINDGINSGVDQIFSVSMAAGHTHTVTITVAQLQMLQANQSVTGLTTSVTGHSHQIDIACA